jgi:hypothetical protein
MKATLFVLLQDFIKKSDQIKKEYEQSFDVYENYGCEQREDSYFDSEEFAKRLRSFVSYISKLKDGDD